MTESDPLLAEPSEVAQTLEAVRQDLQAESGEELADVSVVEGLPRPGVIRLSEAVATVVDELMTATTVGSEDFRSRLISSLDQRLAVRRRRSGLLEPLLKASRLAQNLSVDQVSAAVGIGATEFQELEDGTRELRLHDEKVIARWIWELERDDGAATAALARSVGPSASFEEHAYAGRSDSPEDSADAFVRRVLDELDELRGRIGRERGHSEPSG